ncbi:tetratricopeptide repeat protein [Mycobacterium sp. OAE908]|uniref:ATP-binding protein n=1 Tax=Mycobacterium sp. OAE908 TaxID=2817899 RepID=UPI001AE98B85
MKLDSDDALSDGIRGNRAQLTRFVGRRHELTDARYRLERSRLVTLTGVGGVGKTRLALRLAEDVRRAFPDGVFVVELAEVQDPALLGYAVAEAVGAREPTARWRLTTLTDHLAAKKVLLVLDNCEHLVQACGVLVDALLRSCPGLRVLATSRQRLGIGGETVVTVPPLSTPLASQRATAESLTQYDAVNLFLDRAEAAAPDFELTDDNSSELARLIGLLDGIPLAIELAAVRLRALTLDQILDRMDDRYRLLTGGSRSAPSRQQTLRASIDWTYELCSPEEQLIWARLSVFAGSFELDAAEGICSGDGIDRDSVVDLLTAMIDKSIVTRDHRPGSDRRFVLLETIRQYGDEKLDNAGERDTWRRRHRDWYADLAARTEREWIGPHQHHCINRLHREHANVRSALDFCAANGESQIGLRIVWSLEMHWLAHGLLSEARHWLDQLITDAPGPSVDRARALRLNAWLAIMQGDHHLADARLDGAEAEARATGDVAARAFITLTRGQLAMFRGELDCASEYLTAAVTAFQDCGHPLGEVYAAFEAGLAAGLAGNAAHAQTWYHRCLELTKPLGEEYFRSWSMWAYAVDLWLQGDHDRALEVEQESLRLKRSLDDPIGIAVCLEALAWIAAADGEVERSATLLGAAEAIWRPIGMSLAAIPPLWAYRQRCEDDARRNASDSEFQIAFASGMGLQAEDAIAYALGEVARRPPRSPAHRDTALTNRQLQLSELIAQGLSNREIADKLVISVRTVESHVDHILSRLGFGSRTQIAAWCAGRRIARDDSPRELHR